MCGGDGVVCDGVVCSLLTPRKSTVGLKAFEELCQNDGFGLFLPVKYYYGQCYTGFGIFLFMLIIYNGQCTPMAVFARQMAFGLPNFLSWIFAI